MIKKGNLLISELMKTLIATFVVFAFNNTMIDLINLRETLIQSFQLNSTSQEEGEGMVDDARDFQLYQVPNPISLHVCYEKANSYFKSTYFCCKNSFIKVLNYCPEQYF